MNLKTKDLNFNYPPELVATEPRARGDSRIFLIPRENQNFKEMQWTDFYNLFMPKDLLVLNNTKVMKARLHVGSKEVFFLKTLETQNHWQVLTKGFNLKVGKLIELPHGLQAKVLKTGKPAEIEILKEINLQVYFEQNGHVPLPPYILQLRASRTDHATDIERYQTIWAKDLGSVAAPTASLHFGHEQLREFKKRGVDIDYLTLHVGAGTFLPIDVEEINNFKIHSEQFSISLDLVNKIKKTKDQGGRVWACGTTVMRALETLGQKGAAPLQGATDIFIRPGFDFKIVDGLLTNFHQPESTLLLLAASFAGKNLKEKESINKIINAYNLAVEKKFRLFSYGDLTVIV